MGKLKKEVRDLDGLRFMMNMLKEVRQRESGINMEINPIMNMYQVWRWGENSTGVYVFCNSFFRFENRATNDPFIHERGAIRVRQETMP